MTMSNLDQQRAELQQRGLTTMADLASLLRPLLLPAIKLTPVEARLLLNNSQVCSHFGGVPYFEVGETWPVSKTGRPLDFIMQVVATEESRLPAGIALLQFFYGWEDFPWDTDQPGWLVKTYPVVSPEKAQVLVWPASLAAPTFREIAFSTVQTLPDWEGLDEHREGLTAATLAGVLNEEEPWEAFNEAVGQLIGEQDFQSTLGGHPKWVQGAATPTDATGQKLPLLFQLDSEDKAGLMWGDCGLVYVFYDPQRAGHFTFELQCL